jgi:alkylation response protein AidB-like acyl-CoA dehydrogenase
VAFGKALAEQGSVLQDIGRSRVEIDSVRMLCLSAAHKMDVAGNKAARDEIAVAKAAAPRMARNVVDRAIQVFGAKGLSQDTPLAQFWTAARALQLADGPDEVHLAALAKSQLRRFK